MSRFYIKSIAVSGKDRTPSIISFEDGVNIIYGPSNTGKSYVISCINFMFGAEDTPFEIPFHFVPEVSARILYTPDRTVSD